MLQEGEQTPEVIEADTKCQIDSKIEQVPEGDIDKAKEALGGIHVYLQERANELFPGLESVVWLNYYAMYSILKLGVNFDEYKGDLEEEGNEVSDQENHFYVTLDEFAGDKTDEDIKSKANVWHHKMTDLLREFEIIE